MKTLLFSAASLGLLWIADLPSVPAQEEAPKAVPMKQVPDPGRLEIEVNSDGKTKSFTHPAKAVSEVARAVSRAKRAKDGEEPAFEAEVTLNDQVFTFNDPEPALAACKALSAAMRELPKLRMGLGDLGDIPEVKPEDQPMADPAARPMGAISRAAAIAEIRRRVNLALRRQMVGAGTAGVTLRVPNQAMIQQTINQEVEKARREGWLPPANAPGGFAAGDPREAQKEMIVQTLAFALSQADSTTMAGETSDEAKESNEKPADAVSPEAPDQ